MQTTSTGKIYSMHLPIAELDAMFHKLYQNVFDVRTASDKLMILRDKQRPPTTKQQHVVQFFDGFNWKSSKTHCPISIFGKAYNYPTSITSFG